MAPNGVHFMTPTAPPSPGGRVLVAPPPRFAWLPIYGEILAYRLRLFPIYSLLCTGFCLSHHRLFPFLNTYFPLPSTIWVWVVTTRADFVRERQTEILYVSWKSTTTLRSKTYTYSEYFEVLFCTPFDASTPEFKYLAAKSSAFMLCVVLEVQTTAAGCVWLYARSLSFFYRDTRWLARMRQILYSACSAVISTGDGKEIWCCCGS